MTTRTLPPARAILWEYLAHYPWLDAAIVGGFATLIALARALPESWLSRAETAPLTHMPVAMVAFGIVFLFGTNPSRPRAAPGGYPARLFLYPMSTARLVAWPMLFGSAAMALGWLGAATLVLPRFGYQPPLALGMLAAATAMAWLLAFSWWPFGTSLAQVFGMALVGLALGTVLVVPMTVWGWGPVVAWVLLPIYLAAAYALAVLGVALDRRGDGRGGRGWLKALDRVEGLVEIIPGARSQFPSAARAQLWLEWRSKGAVVLLLMLGLTSAIAPIFVLQPLIDARQPSTERKFLGFLAVLLTQPLVICTMMGGMFAKDEMASRKAGLSPFSATRPMTSAALVVAKLGAAAVALLASCGFVLVTAALFALAAGQLGTIASLVAAAARGHDAIAIALVVAMGPALVLLLAWKGMVGAMVTALTGRPWVAYAAGLGYIAAMLLVLDAAILAAPLFGADVADVTAIFAGVAPPARLLLTAGPVAIGLMLGLKLTLSAVAFRAAIRRRLIARRGLAASALLWTIPAAGFLVLGAVLLRPSGFAPWLTLAMTSALLPPLGRLPTATLALDWDRHR